VDFLLVLIELISLVLQLRRYKRKYIENSIANNSASITHTAVKSACSITVFSYGQSNVMITVFVI